MRRFPALVFSVVTAVACCGLAAGAGAAIGATGSHPVAVAAAAVGPWQTAKEVPGLAALNNAPFPTATSITSVSCASVGNCVAGGDYQDSSGNEQAFVVGETNGAWGTAEEVPGSAALNAGTTAKVTSVSCASAGNCTVGGLYTDASSHTQAFVVGESGGAWGKAEEVPGSGTLNADGQAQVTSVSCASAGNCTVGGLYTNSSSAPQAFVVGESGGAWGTAEEVPGSGTLNADGNAAVASVSCASAGNCTVGGYYKDSSAHTQAFVVGETNGAWGTAEEVPGSGTLNAGGNAEVNSVSCGSAGDCAVGGYYTDASSHAQAFVVGETNGAWGTAEEVPGSGTLNADGNAEVNSVSCGSAGDCAVGGYYTDASNRAQAFVVGESGGAWGTAEEVPGSAALNAGGNAQVASVSCGSAGNCAVGGRYTDSSGNIQAFVVNETSGAWGTAEEVPGSAALNTSGSAQVNSVSCASAGYCATGGSYFASSGVQAFVDQTQSLVSATSTSISLSTAKVTYGDEQAAHVSVTVTSSGGTPGGTVTVKSGTSTVCTATLSGGKGSCTPGATSMPVGTQHLTASYNASANFNGSTSGAVTLTVSKANTRASLSQSTSKVTYGHEQVDRLSVTVSPQFSGTVGGKVTVKRGTSTVCTITLSGGKGSCTPGATNMPAGTQHLAASYGGSTFWNTSASGTVTLTVAKANTRASLSLSTGRVTFGHEQAERASVTVGPAFSGTVGGKVAIKRRSTTLCTITLNGGKGSCTLGARALPKGSYTIVAVYAGSSFWWGSTSSGKGLQVVG